jgi:hypothetical protein
VNGGDQEHDDEREQPAQWRRYRLEHARPAVEDVAQQHDQQGGHDEQQRDRPRIVPDLAQDALRGRHRDAARSQARRGSADPRQRRDQLRAGVEQADRGEDLVDTIAGRVDDRREVPQFSSMLRSP